MTARLAPCFIVRAAAWPTSALAGLGDAALARDAAAREADPTYAIDYAEAVERERRALHAATLADPRFVRALAVTNPVLAERLLARGPGRRRDKRVRHDETTLYRHLARAVGRTEPCDLWAGETIGSWGARTRLASGTAEVTFSPDLRPFQSLLRALRNTERYRRAGRWKLNPTARREGDGWRCWSRQSGGFFVVRGLRGGRELDAALEALARCGPESFEGLCAVAARGTGLSAEDWAAPLDHLAARGALVGGVDLPSRFESPWHALELSASLLEPSDRRAWWSAYRHLRRICLRLSRDLTTLSAADIASRFRSAEGIVVALASALGVPTPTTGRVPLRCDTRLPFTVVLGADVAERVQQVIAEHAGAQSSVGIVDALRRAEIRRRLGSRDHLALCDVEPAAARLADDEVPTSWEALAALVAPASDRDVGSAFDAWRAVFAGQGAEVTLPAGVPAPGPPHATLLFGLDDTRVFVHGVFDDVLCLHARFAWHGRSRSNVPDPLVAWYAGQIRVLERRYGITVADLACPYEDAPNVLSRPCIAGAVVDPWGATSQVPLAGAELHTVGAGAVLLHVPGAERPLAVFAHCSANLARTDPVAQALLQTSFRLSPVVAALQGSRVHFRDELERGHSPRVVLPSGDPVRPRRTMISGSRLAELRSASAARRFALWQREARRAGWPPRVFVGRGDAAPLLVVRDSPIAVEALFAGLRGAPCLTVDDADDETWIEDDDGNRYRTEFAVPFVRARCAWPEARDGATMDAAQREAVSA